METLSPGQTCPGLSLVVLDAMESRFFEELKQFHQELMKEVVTRANELFPKQICVQSIRDCYPVDTSEANFLDILDILKTVPSLEPDRKVEKTERFLNFLPSAFKASN